MRTPGGASRSLHTIPITLSRLFHSTFIHRVGRVATGYGQNGPGIESRWGARFSAPVQTGPGAHSASCTMGTASFQGVMSGRGVTLTPHPLLVPWSWKSRAIPLLPQWAVRPVQSLSACTKVQLHTSQRCFPHVSFTRTVSKGEASVIDSAYIIIWMVHFCIFWYIRPDDGCFTQPKHVAALDWIQ
jgi:hypothetical protein